MKITRDVNSITFFMYVGVTLYFTKVTYSKMFGIHDYLTNHKNDRYSHR